QATGDFVAAAAELAAGVQHGQHHLEGRSLLDLVHVDRDAAAVVGHRHRAVLVDGDGDVVALPGQRLVDAVVDHLVDQVVEAAEVGAADVHAGPPTHRLQPFQDLDVGSVVARPLPPVRDLFRPLNQRYSPSSFPL